MSMFNDIEQWRRDQKETCWSGLVWGVVSELTPPTWEVCVYGIGSFPPIKCMKKVLACCQKMTNQDWLYGRVNLDPNSQDEERQHYLEIG